MVTLPGASSHEAYEESVQESQAQHHSRQALR